jgi:poly(3-hydroxybutyrate) depolymerase
MPRGKMIWKDPFTGLSYAVRPDAIRQTAMLTVEGELDDISAHGQTTAAHEISVNLPANKQYHLFQENVGHYGIFNGTRWRTQIMPRVRHFIRQFDPHCDPIPERDLAIVPDMSAPQYDPAQHSIESVQKKRPAKAKNSEKSGFHSSEETV